MSLNLYIISDSGPTVSNVIKYVDKVLPNSRVGGTSDTISAIDYLSLNGASVVYDAVVMIDTGVASDKFDEDFYAAFGPIAEYLMSNPQVYYLTKDNNGINRFNEELGHTGIPKSTVLVETITEEVITKQILQPIYSLIPNHMDDILKGTGKVTPMDKARLSKSRKRMEIIKALERDPDKKGMDMQSKTLEISRTIAQDVIKAVEDEVSISRKSSELEEQRRKMKDTKVTSRPPGQGVPMDGVTFEGEGTPPEPLPYEPMEYEQDFDIMGNAGLESLESSVKLEGTPEEDKLTGETTVTPKETKISEVVRFESDEPMKIDIGTETTPEELEAKVVENSAEAQQMLEALKGIGEQLEKLNKESEVPGTNLEALNRRLRGLTKVKIDVSNQLYEHTQVIVDQAIEDSLSAIKSDYDSKIAEITDKLADMDIAGQMDTESTEKIDQLKRMQMEQKEKMIDYIENFKEGFKNSKRNIIKLQENVIKKVEETKQQLALAAKDANDGRVQKSIYEANVKSMNIYRENYEGLVERDKKVNAIYNELFTQARTVMGTMASVIEISDRIIEAQDDRYETVKKQNVINVINVMDSLKGKSTTFVGNRGVGKTFIATNYAAMLARNEKVLIVDMDLLNPSLHYYLGSSEGVTRPNKPTEIMSSAENDKYKYITSEKGNINYGSNMQTFMSLDQVTGLLEELENIANVFDKVIIIAPDIAVNTASADCPVYELWKGILTKTGTVIVVTDTDKSNVDATQYITEYIDNNCNIPIKEFLLNKVDLHGLEVKNTDVAKSGGWNDKEYKLRALAHLPPAVDSKYKQYILINKGNNNIYSKIFDKLFN